MSTCWLCYQTLPLLAHLIWRFGSKMSAASKNLGIYWWLGIYVELWNKNVLFSEANNVSGLIRDKTFHLPHIRLDCVENENLSQSGILWFNVLWLENDTSLISLILLVVPILEIWRLVKGLTVSEFFSQQVCTCCYRWGCTYKSSLFDRNNLSSLYLIVTFIPHGRAFIPYFL